MIKEFRGNIVSYEANKRWRLNNPDKRAAAKERNYKRGQSHQTHRRRAWTPEENEEIMALPRPSDAELAQTLKRGVRAIQIQRAKLKKAHL
jgi:hypothetical protein